MAGNRKGPGIGALSDSTVQRSSYILPHEPLRPEASSFGISATMASVVIMRPETDAAFCSALRVTLAKPKPKEPKGQTNPLGFTPASSWSFYTDPKYPAVSSTEVIRLHYSCLISSPFSQGDRQADSAPESVPAVNEPAIEPSDCIAAEKLPTALPS